MYECVCCSSTHSHGCMHMLCMYTCMYIYTCGGICIQAAVCIRMHVCIYVQHKCIYGDAQHPYVRISLRICIQHIYMYMYVYNIHTDRCTAYIQAYIQLYMHYIFSTRVHAQTHTEHLLMHCVFRRVVCV